MLLALAISHLLMLAALTLLDNYYLWRARLDQFHYFLFSFLVLFGAISINSLHLKNHHKINGYCFRSTLQG
jgi:hypothetical protein